MPSRHLAVLCLLWGLLPVPARAWERGQQDAGAFAGVDVPLPPPSSPRADLVDKLKRTPLPFGILGYRARWTGFWKPNVAAELSVNTDTLQADLSAWNVVIPGSSLNAWARGEGLLAGVNTQWIQDGVNHPERGFTASYAQLGFRAAQTSAHLTVEAEVAFRAWLFTPVPLLSDPGATPTPLVVAEPRVRLKYEDRRRDAWGLGLFSGVAAVLEGAVDARAVSRPFGEGPRNRLGWNTLPRRVMGRGFLGVRALGSLWLQASGEAAYGVDEDDLSRTRVGGLNPYTVTMPGAAWGEFLCERFAAVHLEAGLTALPWLYTGLSAHVALVNDPHRVGSLDEVALLRGLATETRVGISRFGVFHLRVGGNVDVLRPGGRGALGAFGWLEVWLPR